MDGFSSASGKRQRALRRGQQRVRLLRPAPRRLVCETKRALQYLIPEIRDEISVQTPQPLESYLGHAGYYRGLIAGCFGGPENRLGTGNSSEPSPSTSAGSERPNKRSTVGCNAAYERTEPTSVPAADRVPETVPPSRRVSAATKNPAPSTPRTELPPGSTVVLVEPPSTPAHKANLQSSQRSQDQKENSQQGNARSGIEEQSGPNNGTVDHR